MTHLKILGALLALFTCAIAPSAFADASKQVLIITSATGQRTTIVDRNPTNLSKTLDLLNRNKTQVSDKGQCSPNLMWSVYIHNAKDEVSHYQGIGNCQKIDDSYYTTEDWMLHIGALVKSQLIRSKQKQKNIQQQLSNIETSKLPLTERFNQLKLGMSKSEVLITIGKKPSNMSAQKWTWEAGDKKELMLFVVFDNGKVNGFSGQVKATPVAEQKPEPQTKSEVAPAKITKTVKEKPEVSSRRSRRRSDD